MSLIHCLIIDDNELDRISIEIYLEKFPFIKLEGSFESPIECGKVIKSKKIDLLFLDINIPGINGLDFLSSLENPPITILVSSYPEYALESYDMHALDFLIKPVKFDRFERSVTRAKELLQIKTKAELYDVHFADDFLTIKESYNLIQIKISDIVYLEALKDYTKVITPFKTYLTLSNLKNFCEKLPEKRFLRVHRSYAVAIRQIVKLEQNELLLVNYRVPIGKTFRNEINRVLQGNSAA